MKGLITNIQRFSLNDGPGIRTTVFFKGCNMKCQWCHNPEAISSRTGLFFYRSKCIGCGYCFKVCPTKAHIIEDKFHKIDRLRCIMCGRCAEVCCSEALVNSATEVSVADVMFEVLQDVPYYKESGGGVTLSGGEVLCQLDFAMKLIEACHEKNIEIAVETNLNADFKKAKALFSSVDLLLCDLKIFNNDEHIRYTGVSNDHVLRNLEAIDDLGIPMIVRTPLIPGATDSNNNIKDIALFVSKLKHLVRYELLNFNPLGVSKYESLDLENSFKNVKPLPKGRLSEIKQLAEEYGVAVKVG